MPNDNVNKKNPTLVKAPTGIEGLDEVTNGGLPVGRTTLLCGSAGTGKTLLAMEFLVRGATQYGEPGVFMAFEENAVELVTNVASLGFDLQSLIGQNRLRLDYVEIVRGELEETGEYDLEGLFVRLGYAIEAVGAKRVVLDTVEALFSVFSDMGALRSELRRLFRWLSDRGVTAVVTAERGDGTLTRHGLEEYVSDCVIALDQQVVDRVVTRRLRIVKYRGSAHGSNEYPFLIDTQGLSVAPITTLGLRYAAPTERISSGIPLLDEMLGGQGYYRGGTTLVSGEAGTGKSSLSAHFVDAACRRGERCLYFTFEESPSQIVRNMASVGLDLAGWRQAGLLNIQAMRPAAYGLEMHLAVMHKQIETFKPQVVILDPITAFDLIGKYSEIKIMLTRLVDSLKARGITALLTDLTAGGNPAGATDVGISSLIDTWLVLRNLESLGERNRGLYIIKSRGMAHSNQIREFLLTNRGVDLVAVRLGPDGILLGSARLAQEAEERAGVRERRREAERKRLALESKQKTLDARIADLQAEFAAERAEIEAAITREEQRERDLREARAEVARNRTAKGPCADSSAAGKT